MVLYLFTRRWGLIVLGALLVISALITGLTSHQVTYQAVPRGTIAHFLVGDEGTDYLQMDGSPTLYLLHEQDFTPSIHGTDTFANGDSVSLLYRPDDTTDIDVTSNKGTHLQGAAYKVEQITALDNGTKVYTSSEYSQNPNGFYDSRWGIAAILFVVGLGLTALAVFLPRRKQQQRQGGFSVAPSAAMGMQGMPNLPPQANSYQQPYQGPAQYPQPQQYGQPPQYQQYPQYQQPGQAGYPPTQTANPYNPGQPQSYPQQPQQQPYPQQSQYPQGQQPGGSYEPTQWANPYNPGQPPQR